MKQAIAISLLAVIMMVSGCSKEPASPVQTSSQQSVVDLAARQQLTEQIQAALPDAAASARKWEAYWPPNPDIDVYAVSLLWGTLPGPSTTPKFTDWSGTLRLVPAGEVKITSTISFEPGQDSIIANGNPLLAAWASRTQADIDGLQFLVFIDRNSPLTVVPMITITTQPIALSLGPDRLKRFDTVIFADNQNAMVIVTRKLSRNSCPAGVIAGLWIKGDNSGGNGTFDGKWMSQANTQSGYMNGKFWTDSTGGRYFFGQYTDMERTTVGYLKGKWAYDDPRMCPTCGTGHGFFAGQFTNLDTVAIGDVTAEFGDFTAPWTNLQMPYRGIWKLWCPKPDLTNSIRD
jgi:hypothetical protein